MCADVSSAPRARPVFRVPHHVLLFAHRTSASSPPRGPEACSCHMVYHSAVPSQGEQHACGFALLPLNTKTRGPAKRTEGATRDAGTPLLAHPCVAEQTRGSSSPLSESFCGAGEDVVDEALTYFRANVLYRKFDVQGARDDEGCLQPSGAVC
jgi:ARP2/3 complex ARPC3 (21 kDa) subunit